MLSIRVNGEPHALAAATLAELLAARGIQRARGVAVAVNGQVVPARIWPEHRLAEGDDVEIVKPVGGG
ncbi:MAG: sulfur carrier protein ThiS [Alphaproteobacteria bacterium]|nr:sulfur carrier protein ThiS [Alphaproteobacteria bacterium]